MSNDTLAKPALDVLLNSDLHDLVQAIASNYFKTYGRYATHSAMISLDNLAKDTWG